MAAILKFGEAQLQGVCDVLAATNGGLTGTEIDQPLKRGGIADGGAGSNKRSRLLEALRARQEARREANNRLPSRLQDVQAGLA